MVSPVSYTTARIPRIHGVQSHRQLPRFGHRMTNSGWRCLACCLVGDDILRCGLFAVLRDLVYAATYHWLWTARMVERKAIWIIIEKAAGRCVSWISKQVDNYIPGTQEQNCGWSRAAWRPPITTVFWMSLRIVSTSLFWIHWQRNVAQNHGSALNYITNLFQLCVDLCLNDVAPTVDGFLHDFNWPQRMQQWSSLILRGMDLARI